MKYTFQQLKDLWAQVGGDPKYGDMAAAVALAESGGNPDSTNVNKNGTTDRGLWQINSIHGSQSTFDPIANARAAVAISANGTNWRPWCTAWSQTCGKGTFMGAGSPVLKYLPSGYTPAGTDSGSAVTPASYSASPSSSASLLGGVLPDSLWSWIGIPLKVVGYWLIVTVGVSTMLGGFVVLFLSTNIAKTTIALAGGGAVQGAAAGVTQKAVVSSGKPAPAAPAAPEPAPEYAGRHRATDAPKRRDALFAPGPNDAAQRRTLAENEDKTRAALIPQQKPRPLRRKAQTGDAL